MRRLLCLCLCLVGLAAVAEEPLFKVVGMDYPMNGTEQERPLSLGVCSWTDKENDFSVGAYFDFAFISVLKDHLRLGTGFVFAPTVDRRVDMRLETSLTVRFDWLTVGVYYAPFWGLVENIDNPYGFLVGYSFKF
jgi:hypothetical protein